MRKTKRKILSGAMALAMAASVLSWAPVQAYAEEAPAVVTATEETQAEETPAPEAPEETEAPEATETPTPAETATPEPEVTVEPTVTPEVTAEPTAEPEATAEPEVTALPTETPPHFENEPVSEENSDTLIVTDWQWVTEDENIAENDTLDLSADDTADDDGIAAYSAVVRPTSGSFDFDSLVAQLPNQVTVQKSDGTTVTLNIKNWASDEYKQKDDNSWPQYGNYLFTAELENGVHLDANAKKLQIQVFLGDEPTAVPDGLDIGDNTDNGLPNYGTRIIFDDRVGNATTDPTQNLVFRIKYSNPDERAVLEWYRYNATSGKYERIYDYTYFINEALIKGGYEGGWNDFRYFRNMFPYDPAYAYVFNKQTTDWQYACFSICVNDYNSYAFHSSTDVLVLRSSTGGTNDSVPEAAGGNIQYEISGFPTASYLIEKSATYSALGVAFEISNDTSSANNPLHLADSSYVELCDKTDPYGTPTGTQSIPAAEAGKVQTIRVKSRILDESEKNETVTWNGNNSLESGAMREDSGLPVYPKKLTSSDLKNLTVIRADGTSAQENWSTDSAAHLQVTIGTPDRPVNRAWRAQFGYRAALYTYDAATDTYSLCQPKYWQQGEDYYEQKDKRGYFYYYEADKDDAKAIGCAKNGPLNTPWGIHIGIENEFQTYLQAGQAIVIFPTQTKYEYSTRVQISDTRVNDGNTFVLDSATGNNSGSTWDEGRRIFQGGLISSYNVPNSTTGQEIVLHISKQGDDAKSITFNKLTEGLRTLKVNLFDYTVPDNWHNPADGVNSAQSDAQLRFLSDTDTNTNDPLINQIHQSDRRMPSTGIVADKLSSITDENGNTLYNLLPDFKFTTPFSVNLFDLNTETKNVTTPGFSLRELGNGVSISDGRSGGNTRYKFVYPNVNFQFKYDDATNTYSYNSHTNHAQYDRTTNTVYEYDHALGMGGLYNYGDWSDKENYVIDSWGTQAAGFFPFDTYVNIDENGEVQAPDDSAYGLRRPGYNPANTLYAYQYKPAVSNDGTTLLRAEMELDYHFGMSMQHQFTVPYDGKVKGNDMLFTFSGDDDMWLFVDGQLVLDLGGIHEAATGTINFTKGTYSINGVENSLHEVLPDYSADTYAKSGAWAGGTDHSFQMFYLERGGTLSNLSISFNLPDEVVQATKVWNDNDQPEKRQDVTLYLEQTANGTDWVKTAGSNKTIAKNAEGDALTVDWMMPMYDETGTKLTYRVREAAGEGCTNEVFIKNGDTWVSEKDAGYADALAAGHEFQIVNTIPKPTETPTPTAAPTATPKPAEPTAIPTTAKPSNNTPNSNNSSNGSNATATPTEAPKAAVTTARIPQTSDNFPLVGAIIGMMVGAAGVAYVGKKKRK